MDIGSGEFIVVVVVTAVFLVFPIWSLADAATRSQADFERIGQSRSTWILLLLLGIFCFAIVGAVLGIYYLTAVRPKLRAAS
jgi:hypothetical protein